MNKNIVLSIMNLRVIAVLFLLSACQDSKVEYSCNNIPELEKRIAKQDEKAMFTLGQCYKNGDGVDKSMPKAADKEHVEAQTTLGFIYHHGRGGVKQDFAKALELYQKAVDKESAEAQNNLGVIYQNGQGVKQDFAKALELYQKAADKEYAEAQNNLGFMYHYGQGVEQDFLEAIKLYHKSADQGYYLAREKLDSMYKNGQGAALLKEALLMQEYADQGDKKAIETLKSWGGIAEPFGCKVAISDFNQISKLYTLQDAGINQWNGGKMYKISPISQVDFPGIEEVELIFDDKQILDVVMAKFNKGKLRAIIESLEQKYKLINKNVPYVGSASARFVSANCIIILDSPHLRNTLDLFFVSSKFSGIHNRKIHEDSISKKQKENSML
jgi:hypothetical protein